MLVKGFKASHDLLCTCKAGTLFQEKCFILQFGSGVTIGLTDGVGDGGAEPGMIKPRGGGGGARDEGPPGGGGMTPKEGIGGGGGGGGGVPPNEGGGGGGGRGWGWRRSARGQRRRGRRGWGWDGCRRRVTVTDVIHRGIRRATRSTCSDQ